MRSAGNISIHVRGTSGELRLTNDGSVGVGNDIILDQTGSGDILMSTASGSATATINGAITLTALGDEIIFVSNIDVSIQPSGSPVKFFGGAGAGQHAAIIDAAGGAVIDAECRTATNTILAALRVWGLVHT